MTQTNYRIALLAAGLVTAAGLVRAQGPGGGPPTDPGGRSVEARLAELEEKVARLEEKAAAIEGRAAKLEGQITASDLVGSYSWSGLQTELSPGYVASYRQAGTMVLRADGTFTLNGSEGGNSLLLNPVPRQRAPFTGACAGGACPPINGNWTYSNGQLDLGFGFQISVAAGGRVLTGATFNHSDGTTVIFILTRLQ